jgi:hypothetical protein
MGEMLLNGRVPLDWERAAMARGYAHVPERDTEVLAGLTGAGVRPEPPVRARAVSDIAVDFATARRRP